MTAQHVKAQVPAQSYQASMIHANIKLLLADEYVRCMLAVPMEAEPKVITELIDLNAGISSHSQINSWTQLSVTVPETRRISTELGRLTPVSLETECGSRKDDGPRKEPSPRPQMVRPRVCGWLVCSHLRKLSGAPQMLLMDFLCTVFDL